MPNPVVEEMSHALRRQDDRMMGEHAEAIKNLKKAVDDLAAKVDDMLIVKNQVVGAVRFSGFMYGAIGAVVFEFAKKFYQ